MKWISIESAPEKSCEVIFFLNIYHYVDMNDLDCYLIDQGIDLYVLPELISGFIHYSRGNYSIIFNLPPKTYNEITTEFMISRITHYCPLIHFPFPKIKRKRNVTAQRKLKVLKRDNFTCKNCNLSPSAMSKIELEIDHIVPVSKGGRDNIENLQVLCKPCNRIKYNYNVSPFGS